MEFGISIYQRYVINISIDWRYDEAKLHHSAQRIQDAKQISTVCVVNFHRGDNCWLSKRLWKCSKGKSHQYIGVAISREQIALKSRWLIQQIVLEVQIAWK